MAITASNETPFRRREYVLFGVNAPTPCTCFSAPDGHINVAYVDFDANTHEAVTPIPDGNRGSFVSHPAVDEAFASNFEYRATINGRQGTFVHVERLVDNRRVRIDRWRMRDPGPSGVSEGTFQLFTYWFHNHATIRFELLFFYENLTQQKAPKPSLGFAISGPTNLRELVMYDISDTSNLLLDYTNRIATGVEAHEMIDAQGAYFEGCLPFETPAMRDARTTHPEAITQSAQMLHPLYGLVPHPTWGIWAQTPLTWDQTKRDQDYAYARLPGTRGGPRNPNANLGYITVERAPGPGGQPEYGAWTHVYNLGDQDSRSLWPQHRAAMRHVNRQIWETEATGEPLNPADANNAYPNAKTYGEFIHWQQAATNRYRRTPTGTGSAGRGTFAGASDGCWWGHDPEHIGWNCLVEDFLLTGSFAARHLLIMLNGKYHANTLESAGMEEARSVGRFFMGAAMCYRATGLTEWLKKCVDLWPVIRARWLALCAPTDAFRPYGFKKPDPQSGYAPEVWVWRAWQEMILVAGVDAALLVDTNHSLGIFTGSVRTQMLELQLAVARAVVNLSFAPAHTCGTTNFADAERWATTMNFGTGVIPVSPPSAAAVNYCDDSGLNRAVGIGEIAEAWAIMGVRIARRIDPAMAARCDIIENRYRPGILAFNPTGNTGNDRLPQYLGTG